jgi:hypothetical protein
MNAEKNSGAEPRIEAAIDAALHQVGSATPAAGLEGRILNRLAAERLKIDAEPAPARWAARIRRLPRLPARALGLATACLMGFVIVAGSVSHSRRIRPGQETAPPVLVLPGHGIGAASAVHPAAPASTPVPAGQPGRAARRSGPGRARIAPHSRKAPGAVPAPPSDKPSSDVQN